MKKLLCLALIAAILTAMVTTVSAASADLDIGLLKVLYKDSGKISVDGEINASEWNEASSLNLKCGTNMQTWTKNFPGEIQFFYSWSNDGFYIAAKISDSTLTLTPVSYEGDLLQDRFQVALNPCGLIYEEAAGLFFSFYPTYDEYTDPSTVTSGKLGARKHNWEESVDYQQDIKDAGYKGAFTVTEYGWDMEAVIPWSLISSKDRVWDIIDYYTEGAFCSVFDPKSADRERAFAKAIIAYIDCRWLDDSLPNTARTVKSNNDVLNFNTDSYDITFKFYQKGEDTSNENIEFYTVAELKTIFRDVDWSAWDANEETEKETQPPVTSAPQTDAPETDPPVTKPPVTQPPVTNPPVTKAPVTEAPATEPVTQAPVTDAPSTEETVTQAPATDTAAQDTGAVAETRAETDTETNPEVNTGNEKDGENSSAVSTVMVIAVVAIAVAVVAVCVAVVAVVLNVKKNKN